MCGRTSLYTPVSDLEARFDATAVREFQPRYNIAPGDELAVVRNEESDSIDLVTWGLVPGWVDDPDDWHAPINARAETVDEKTSFQEAFERRRCLVLADGFYEWQGTAGGKQPYRAALEDSNPFAMAGLWERWSADEERRTTCTIVTTAPNEVVEPIHDRMPVILEPEDEQRWLRADAADERKALLDPYDRDDLTAYRVSRAVNDPANDRPEIILPEENPTDQAGLGDFSAD